MLLSPPRRVASTTWRRWPAAMLANSIGALMSLSVWCEAGRPDAEPATETKRSAT